MKTKTRTTNVNRFLLILALLLSGCAVSLPTEVVTHRDNGVTETCHAAGGQVIWPWGGTSTKTCSTTEPGQSTKTSIVTCSYTGLPGQGTSTCSGTQSTKASTITETWH
jgi:hypothetical protein